MQTGQAVDQTGVLTVEIVRLDMQLDEQYRRGKDRVFRVIFVMKLIEAGDRRPEFQEMIPSKPGLGNVQIPAEHANSFDELKMLFFIQVFEIRQRILKPLK